MDSKPLDLIKGAKLTAVTLNDEKDKLSLVTERGTIILCAVGDCCSQSWFESVDASDALGGEVTTWRIDNPQTVDIDKDLSQEYDYLQVYFMCVATTKGRVLFEMRNSSNGYYGGYVDIEWQANEFGKVMP